MIQFNSVNIDLPNSKRLLSDISFSVDKGERVLLTGESGVGKSTLLKSVLGGVSILSGEVLIDGVVLSAKTINDIRALCSYIPQEPRLPSGTVDNYFSLINSFANNSNGSKLDIKELFNVVKLPYKIGGSLTSRLSGGERQRVAIVSALMINRPIVICDEITSALDSSSRSSIIEYLANSNLTIFSSSHSNDWESICRKIVINSKGRIDG